MENQSIFLQDIKKGLDKKIISISENESRITYHCSRDYSTSFKNPEEKVRASYFAELVLDYNYPKENIDIEVTVPRRTPEDRADIVIYNDKELKEPYLVVECKRDGITDSEFKQAIEQAFGNANSLRAKYATVVAGITKTAFDIASFKPSEREKNVISDIPVKYGKAPKYRFIKGGENRELETVSRDELIKTLEKAHNTVWQGGKLAPTTAFDEVSKLLFCKLKDEKNTTEKSPYLFQVGTHETVDEVYGRINGIYQKAKKEDSEVFKEDIRLDPKVVYNVVEHLQSLAISKIDLDVKGVAFERFMQDFFKGKMGQFFTPRTIVQFCIKIMNPQKDELVLDPACGSGGFLLNAMDSVRIYVEKNYRKEEAKDHWHKFAERNLFGIEINDQIARVCKMNMIIHDDGHTNVISTDSLNDFKDITKKHANFRKDHFDIILTNPPFGATIKKSEKEYIDNFELGKDRKNQKTEILFIERCIDFVKPETGKMAIVLPDGILTNSSLQYVRDHITERCEILAVVSIPQEAFMHYGAGVKSSLVFLRRKGEDEKLKDYPIFMAIAEKIGYDASGREINENNFPDIFHDYKQFQEKGVYDNFLYNNSFIEKNIKNRFDPYFYNKEFKILEADLKNIKHTLSDLEKSFLDDKLIKGILPKNDQKSGKAKVVQISNIMRDGTINIDSCISADKSIYCEDQKLKKGDILIVVTGATIGKIGYWNFNNDRGYYLGGDIVKFNVNNKFNSRFIQQFLLSTIGNLQILRYITGATNKHLSPSDIRKIKIPEFSIDQQNNIVKKLDREFDEAEKLKAESKRVTEEAKKKFEKTILS